MTIQEAIDLIRHNHITSLTKTVWADLGCGSGIFTHALANLLNDDSLIYAVDKNISAFKKRPFSKSVIMNPVELNFETSTLPFNNLDGILMANSLHFVKDKKSFLEKIKKSLNDNGFFLLVEYDTDISNYWVPYPVSFLSLKQIFDDAGYSSVTKINERPSRFNKANLYAAIITK
ncbi:MAG: class I SAM-dependent methyltransferase [Ginsengibacter sp.]